jgi:uncharacterized protein (TIGR02594 family)
MKRRIFLQGCTLAVPGIAAAQSVPEGTAPEGSFDLRTLETTNLLELRSRIVNETGTASPLVEEIDTALALLENAPNGVAPLKIGEYFWNLHAGLLNTDDKPMLEYYAKEWPVRANPLIVGFFKATDYGKPSGDTTAWCAAFVNWVLVRAAIGKVVSPEPTRSAASSSFRNWGDEAVNPIEGDIAVFRNTAGDPNFGHVAFFLQYNEDKSHVLILGGNQRPSNKSNTGEVNKSWFPVKGRSQVLHSIRSAGWLHAI